MDPALQSWLDAHAAEITMQESGKVRVSKISKNHGG
jgi:hypothetical protein